MPWCERDNDSREPNQDANNERPARGTGEISRLKKRRYGGEVYQLIALHCADRVPGWNFSLAARIAFSNRGIPRLRDRQMQ